ncbi:unnamed protein product [Prunus armeniaca]|uniref:Uncharacterized protein n=1 Tax=Prunus armeniaca TaxID=36596 RepID=A0A6J5TKM8_PRUAR|nr:unnamed protein product [Prunus armeniaca]
MSKSDQKQSSPKPLSPRTAAVRAGLSRNYSSSSTESKSYESEGCDWPSRKQSGSSRPIFCGAHAGTSKYPSSKESS